MIDALLNSYKGMVENRIEELFPEAKTGYSEVSKAARYSLLSGGKRIRPAVMMEFCKLCGGKAEDVLDFAVALEMIHTYSLIHDDLPCMDNDDMRRGKPSCHKAFGEDIALLAGDTLLTEAFFIASNANVSADKVLKAISFLSSNAGLHGMIGGQVLDLSFEKNEPDAMALSDMYMRKTSALLIAAASIGCIAAGADSEENLKSAAKYGYNLGLAFQIIDDILDVTADEKKLGKPVGSDEKNNKTTFVSIYGLEQAFAIAAQLSNAALDALDEISDNREKTEVLYELTNYLLDRNS
ncbi:MAG: polyprenyl synthetase family protein [Clostridia bacterium]|nr:polyprenyl synthetase family protein [Clostridia bacterium]